MTDTKPTPGLQKTLADFKPPYSARWAPAANGMRLELLKPSGRLELYLTSLFGSEQACIDAAWEAAYGPDTPSEIDTLREVNAELLKALRVLVNAVGSTPNMSVDDADSIARAAIQKAESR